MGTREVYEQKIRKGNLYHDPTMKPGLGTARCPRCLSLVSPSKEDAEWKISPVLHDTAAVVGTGLGAMISAVSGFNSGIPYLQKPLRGQKWLPLLVGLPPLAIYSAASAAFGAYALPQFSQLAVTSYYTASSASIYGVSLITRHIEEDRASKTQT